MLSMEELNFVGGSFDDCEQYHSDLTAISLHTATCPTPWEPADLCIECFASNELDDVQVPSFRLHGLEDHTAVVPIKTYAQVAAWSTACDIGHLPAVKSTCARPPQTISTAESARSVLHSQYREHLPRPQRQRQVWHDDDVIVNPLAAVPNSRPQRPTYAAVAQLMGEQSELHDKGSSYPILFTSTENSLGLPNQSICRVPQQAPYRTVRTSISHITPYPIGNDRTQDMTIPTLTQPERNLDPRNPYTLVQRTRRGGHREPTLPASSNSSTSSPLSCGTLSTASAASRSRRKEVQDRPHPCLVPGCFWRFVNPKDLKRHEKIHTPDATPGYPCPHPSCTKSFTRHDNRGRHIRSEHGDDSGLGTSRSSSQYASVSHFSFS